MNLLKLNFHKHFPKNPDIVHDPVKIAGQYISGFSPNRTAVPQIKSFLEKQLLGHPL
jgi:hypothetical protein